jgi:hypothetical protein
MLQLAHVFADCFSPENIVYAQNIIADICLRWFPTWRQISCLAHLECIAALVGHLG